jgi:hypothetical protein
MALYQLTAGTAILRESDQAWIPADPTNVDFQSYQAWLAAGNTPDPAPVVAPPSVIPLVAFWARFTQAEQTAIETLAASTPAIASAMMFASLIGTVNLTSGPIVASFMTQLVSAGAITAARSATILTP